MWDYLAVFSSDQRVIDSLDKEHSSTNVKIREDDQLIDHLPFDFKDRLQNNVVFVRPAQSRFEHEDFINSLFEDLFSNDLAHIDNVILRYDSSSGELKAAYREKDQHLRVNEEFPEQAVISSHIMERCGIYDLDTFADIKGVKLDEITHSDRALLAHGRETEALYTTSTDVTIENVQHTIQTEGRLILKEEEHEVVPKVKPVYKELQIPSIVTEQFDKDQIKELIENQKDYLQFENPSNPKEQVFAFLDSKRNKIVLKKDSEFSKDLIIKANSKKQSHLILHLSTQEREELCMLKSVTVNKSFQDIDGGAYNVSATLHPKIDFIRKELSFTQKTLRQDQDLIKKSRPKL